MDTSRISVSALGRDVVVGDLYNYYTDDIRKSNIAVPVECVRVEHKAIPESERSFFFNQPAKFKPSLLGINSHVQQSIEQGFVDLDQLWFAEFLRPNVLTDSRDNEAIVTAFFRVVRRTETLDRQFLESKIYDYQLDSGGRATHLVEQVGYGSELICSMRRTVDWRRETKESVEENIYLVAKAYFERIFGPKATSNNNIDPPAELDKLSCRILSSLEDVQPTETSFRQSCEFLRDVVNFKEDNQPAKLWRPIYIVRCQIPRQIETRIFWDRISDKRLKIERKWHWILKESRRILRHPYLNQIPPIARAVYQFLDLLEPIEKEIKQFNLNVLGKKYTQEQVGSDIKIIIDSVLLSDMVNWLIQRRCDIDAMCLLFKGKQMAMYDIAEIESRPHSTIERRARVFVLKVEYNPDPLMKRVQNLIGDPNPIIKIPVFPVVLSGNKERLAVVSQAFHEFSEEAHWCSNDKNNYQIGLVPVSSALDDATIKTILYPAIEFNKQTCSPVISQQLAASSKTEQESYTHKEDESLPCQQPTSAQHNLKNSSQIHLKTTSSATPKQNPYEKVSYLLMKTFCQVFND
ncbi:hypothetical protein DAPPUDRAFT_119523 [Daphnia pulex]|uniref:Uncharacterized protein n=1 Tax=Daphnia pulex TaxID=6669 RepID=E9HYR6_DAPPU|nr:hypothetical protein DAPPUDRAFT_119523 [Daphnia pulex]|eukprot:EFX63114.1 hypothetical protein DAPPUDRAFT_119523 [Daphnia pulex]